MMKWLKNLFSPAPVAPTPPTLEWFRVRFDDTRITLDVDPPSRPAWEARIEWGRITRVCFKAGGWEAPDEVYLFTDERPESYLLPTIAEGGHEVWLEIIRRGLFDAGLAIEAASAVDRLFCWPQGE